VERAAQGQQFPRCLRLRQAQEFRDTLRSRRRAHGHWFNLAVSPNAHGRSRLGIVVAKKVVPRAVDRNRLKRVVRDDFRRLAGGLPAVDLIVQVKRMPVGAQAQQSARAELRHLLASIP
jgi:ribonuclease P protein component